jgi:hypothetical protein
VLVIFLFSLVASFEFIVIAEREATRPVAATRMYERERERESCVFWRLFAFYTEKEKEKCQLFSVKREKKDKKTQKRHSERNFEEFIIEKEYNTNNTNNGQRTFET